MRVCYFFSNESDTAKAALPDYAEMVCTAESPLDYWRELVLRWNGRDDLLVIEQDIIIHGSVIDQISACNLDWCLFPYIYGSGSVVNISGPMVMTRGLGCTFFSARIQQDFPLQAIFDHPKALAARQGCSGQVCSDDAMCWRHIDQTINHVLESAGCEPHRHEPFVKHEHYVNSPVTISDNKIVTSDTTEMVLTVKRR